MKRRKQINCPGKRKKPQGFVPKSSHFFAETRVIFLYFARPCPPCSENCSTMPPLASLDPIFSNSFFSILNSPCWIHPTPDSIKKGEAEVVNNPRNNASFMSLGHKLYFVSFYFLTDFVHFSLIIEGKVVVIQPPQHR